MKKLLLPMVALLVCSGCASLISPTQKVSFESEPAGADILVNGEKLGTTPGTVYLQRDKKKIVVVRLAGYEDAQLELKTTTNPNIWWNVIFLTPGVLSSTTDHETGAFYKYEPDHYLATLVPRGQAPMETAAPMDADRSQATRFIMVNYYDLAKELSKSEGPHVDSLLQLLGVKEDGKANAIATIKDLFVKEGTIAGFANAVTNAFVKKP